MPQKRRLQQKLQDDGCIEGPAAKVPKPYKPRPKNPKRCFICELPNEILERIVGYISYWHRPRLRRTCKRMRHICDSLLLHEFEKFLVHYKHFEPIWCNYAALTAIKVATWPYVQLGFGSVFCGTILPLIWNRPNFSPNHRKIKLFLRHFYKLVHAQIGDTNAQLSRLLYTVTLMRLLRKFRSSKTLTSVRILPTYWRIVFELRGPWIGILWSSKSTSEFHERGKLLMILCEIMIADCTQRAFKKVWECDSEVFVYGNDTSEKWRRLRNPTTVFTINISAPLKIVSLLRSALEDDEMVWPKRIPRNEFVAVVDIACREAHNWGCCSVHHIEIGPVLEVNDGREIVQIGE